MAAGKTFILLWALVWRLIELAISGKSGAIVALFSATYSATLDRHLMPLKEYFPEWLGTLTLKPLPQFKLDDAYGGGIIAFRNMQNVEQYKSSQFAMIAIDELTEITEDQFNFLLLRKHRNMTHVPVIAATNPTGIGRAWVDHRFGCTDPGTRDMPGINKDTGYVRRGFKYIKAIPSDNPTLSQSAIDEMMNKPEELRRAYFEGDWTIFEGQFFKIDTQVHVFDSSQHIPDEWKRIRMFDKGYSHPFVCLWAAIDFEGNMWVYREYSVAGEYTDVHKEAIAYLSVKNPMPGPDGKPIDPTPEHYDFSVGDITMFAKDRSFASNKTSAEIINDRTTTFSGGYRKGQVIGSFGMIRARNWDRPARWMALLNAFGFSYENVMVDGYPQRNIKRYPKIRISASCKFLLQSITNAMHDPKKSDDVKKSQGTYGPGRGDDELDTLGYGWLMATSAKVPPPDEGDEATYEPNRDTISEKREEIRAQNTFSWAD